MPPPQVYYLSLNCDVLWVGPFSLSVSLFGSARLTVCPDGEFLMISQYDYSCCHHLRGYSKVTNRVWDTLSPNNEAFWSSDSP